MATPRFKIDWFDPEVQQILNKIDYEIYPDGGGLALDTEIPREYLAGFRRPYISALMADVLTGRWKLGTTMTEVADRLNTDHPTISRALRWGELPWTVESFLLACPTIPNDWQKIIARVFHARHRSALIAVAEYLWRKRPGNRWPMPVRLSELHVELMAALFETRKKWMQARHAQDITIVRDIFLGILDDETREIVPAWLGKRQRIETTQLINRLRDDDDFTFTYLCLLQNRWEATFVAAHAATEGAGWIEDKWSEGQ